MDIREKLRERVQPHLEADERIEAIFCAQGGPYPLLVPLIPILMVWTKHRIVAVTNRSILVFEVSQWAPTMPKRLLHRFSPAAPLGPLSGLFAIIHLPGERLYVHKRFHEDVAAADAVMVVIGGIGEAPNLPSSRVGEQRSSPGRQAVARCPACSEGPRDGCPRCGGSGWLTEAV
jgi:hypothetical protein